MTKIQRLEREIEELTREELAAFRKWFREYDSAAWDEQIEEDASAGKLDKLAGQPQLIYAMLPAL